MPTLDTRERNRLRVALAILASNSDDVSNDHLDDLGYDLSKLSYYGRPTIHEVKVKCADIIADIIISIDNQLD